MRALLNEADQLIFGILSSLFEPVRDIFLLIEAGERENLNPSRNGTQVRCDLFRVRAALLIVVGKDDNFLPFEALTKFRPPLARSAAIRRRYETARSEGLYVLLTLGNEDKGGRKNLGQAIGHAGYVSQIPDPAAVTVWPPLPKILAGQSHNLIEKFPFLVSVIVELRIRACAVGAWQTNCLEDALPGFGRSSAVLALLESD
jgi:hypothetical protein